jgi:hypothetical protein
MTGDCHVPFRGSPGVKFPRATRRDQVRVVPAWRVDEGVMVSLAA